MDTSETYIKMCDCEEIQNLKPTPTILGANFWHYPEGFLMADIIWLPRQDQLQEMVGEYMAVNLVSRFHRYLMTEFYAPFKEPQPSIEQLWLAFTMKEKYGKFWAGGNWVKEKE